MFNDVTPVTLGVAASALAQRQRVIANNVSNLETPNFRAGRVDFESSLRAAVADGDPRETSVTVTPSTGVVDERNNNVSLDEETLYAMKTQQQYSLVMRALTDQYTWVSSAIKG